MSNANFISLAHGGGGKLSKELEQYFRIAFSNEYLLQNGDGAILPEQKGQICCSTDTFVVDPLFFPGGDIGKLAVSGTVNDLLTMGCSPHYLTLGVVLEEGFSFAELEKIINSIAEAAQRAKVKIVAGDTKVVGKGQAGGMYICTTGIGTVSSPRVAMPGRLTPGLSVVISGNVGEHGLAILQAREALPFVDTFYSDVEPLTGMLEKVYESGVDVFAMRDPSRGGLAAVLNELAVAGNVGIALRQDQLPVRQQVKGACAILGVEPLELACEGRMVFFVETARADDLLTALHADPAGRDASIIGYTFSAVPPRVLIEGSDGESRILAMPLGESLPRIC